MNMALNGFFILKPYISQGIRPEIRGGLSLPGQKHNLVALEMLADTKVDGAVYKEGQFAFIAEDLLMTGDWAKRIRKAPGIESDFIVVESRYVTMVGPSNK